MSRSHGLFVGVLYAVTEYQHTFLARAQLAAVMVGIQLAVSFPPLCDGGVVLQPEHTAEALLWGGLQGGRRGDGLPPLHGMIRAGNEGQFVYPTATVGDTGGWEAEVLTRERERLLVERKLDSGHRLVEHLPVQGVGIGAFRIVVTADLGAQRLRLTRNRASTDAEDGAATGNVVQVREVLGQLQGVPLRHDIEHRTDRDSAGPFGQRRGEQNPVRHDLVALMLEVVFGQPEDVETQALR